MTTPLVFPNPPTLGQLQSITRSDAVRHTWSDVNGQRWNLQGGMTPWAPNAAVTLKSIKGVSAPIVHKDAQSANQDGKDWLGASYDNCEVDLVLEISGRTRAERRTLGRQWIHSWRGRQLGTWYVETSDMGSWWLPLRAMGEIRDVLPADHLKTWEINWSARSDLAFWQSSPSLAQLVATGPGTMADPQGIFPNNFLPLVNIGTIDGWPQYDLQGPGIFVLGNNGPSGGTIPFVSIEVYAGERVRLTSTPRLRTAIELNTNTNVYPRLVGRFINPVPAATNVPTVVQVPVYVEQAVPNVTAINARLVPMREWPE